jgi:hypothetical protein
MRSPKEISRVLDTVANDPARKPLHTMLAEIIQLWIRDRALPTHYYKYLLYRRDSDDDILAYVGFRNIGKVYARLRDPVGEYVINHKVLFDRFFRQEGFVLPRLIGYSARNLFVLGDGLTWVSDRQQLLRVLESMVGDSPNARVFAKPTAGTWGGMGCFTFGARDVSRVCADVGQRLLSSDYVYQEVIVQHPKMAELHPSSVNTLRIDTYEAADGEVSVMSAFARMGGKGSCTDNVSGGGCFVGVDLETGTLMRRGFVVPEYGASILESHPDTGVIFDGFGLPYFREALGVVKRAAELTPLVAVGWDLAIGPDGPVLVEGNAPYQAEISEMAYGGYWRNPVFRRLVADYASYMRRIEMQYDRHNTKVDRSACRS